MSILEAVIAICAALLGGFLASVISANQERWKFRQERQAQKEDRAAAKDDKTEELSEELEELRHDKDQKDVEYSTRLTVLDEVNQSQTHALCLILLDRILGLGANYISRGEVTFDELRVLRAMYGCYHNELGGNGDADIMMSAVEDLFTKATKAGSHHEK